tara:strand:- start:1258 stop:3249 length:1992 start_codon:yes stop_codon:yes gene_type:complete
MGDFYNRGGGGVTATSVTSDDLEIDDGTLSIDATNNRVGMGTTAPGTQLQVESNTPYVTLKNDTSENSDGGCESKLIFEDHANASLGQIEVSHNGSSDDTKGKMILSTHSGSSLLSSIEIIEGNVTKIGQDSPSSADVLTYDGAKWVAEAPTTGDITGVTAGDGLSGGGNSGAVTLALDLNELSAAAVAVANDSIAIIDSDDDGSKKESIADLVTAIAGTASSTGLSASSGVLSVSDLHPVGVDGANNQILTDDGDGTVSSESKLTFDGTTLLVNSDVTATTNHTTVGAHIDYDATGIVASGQTGNNVGLDVDINSNTPTMVGAVNNTGLDIDLTGGTSGTQTNIGIDVNVTGADTNYSAVFNGGNVGIGTSAPGTQLQLEGATPYVTLKNNTSENTSGGCESKLIFEDHGNNALGQIEVSHVGSSDDEKGQLILSTNNDSGLQTAITISDAQVTTFAANVVVGGTTPKITIGDAGTEDTMLVFDGNAADFRIGIDDGTDTLEIGKGSAHGTTPAIKVDSNVNIQILHNSAVADGEFSGDLTIYQAGEDLTAGEVVYFKSDGKVWKAVATAAATSRAVAMCTASVSADAMGVFLLKGFARFNSEFPTWTIGGVLYTPEAETSGKNVPEQAAPDTDGDFVQILGYAISGDAVYFCPDSTVVEVA